MRSCLVVGAALLAAGCVATPRFDKLTGVSPKSVIDVIECELITARGKVKGLEAWTAVAELSLQVDEQATLTPAFTHTSVVDKTLTRIFDWGVKFDTQAQRIYSETVTFRIGVLKATCDRVPTQVSLNGNLGLVEVIQMAFGSFKEDDAGIGFSMVESPGPSERRPRAVTSGQRNGKGGKKEAAFGTSIEFLVTKGLSPTGPTWSLLAFKGPGKLFGAQRTDTHKVTISFAKQGGEMEASSQNNKISIQGLTSAIKQLNRPGQ